MQLRTRAAGAAVTAVFAAATLAATAGPAAAATTVHFLTKGQWPQGDRWGDWHSKPVKDGLRDKAAFCLEGILPTSRTQYREFFSDVDAGGIQYVSKLATSTDAKALITRLRNRVPVCADRFADALTGGAAEVVVYPFVDLEEGLSRRGVFTSGTGTEFGTVLWAFGRDGRYVTVVELDQIGKKSGAPVAKFTATAKKALDQLL